MTPVANPLLDDSEWRELMEMEAWPSITGVLRLHASELSTEKTKLRLRAFRGRVEAALSEAGMDHGAQALLDAIELPALSELRPDADGTIGLLFLLSPEHREVRAAPASLPERVSVADHFVLTDLVATLDEPASWWVLGVSDDGATLTHVHHGTPRAVDLPLERPDRAAANAERTAPVPGGSSHAHRTAGRGSSTRIQPQGFGNEQVDDIERRVWYGVIADALAKTDIGEDPVVLVADTVHHGAIHDVCNRAGLMPGGVQRSPHGLDHAELHRLSREHVAPLARPDAEALRDAWHAADREDRAGTNLDEARRGAERGRIALACWPTTPGSAIPVEVDDVLRKTVLHGGRIVPLPPEALPQTGAPLAVVYRWPMKGETSAPA